MPDRSLSPDRFPRRTCCVTLSARTHEEEQARLRDIIARHFDRPPLTPEEEDARIWERDSRP